MADDFGLSGILGSFAGLATSGTAAGWLSLGINLILSTIVGGIVLLIVMEILERGWGESIHVGKVFLFMLAINIINSAAVFGIASPVSFISSYISFIPYSYLLVSVLLWVGLMKLFFGEMSIKHAVITGVIGFGLSMVAIPYITGMVRGFLPI